MARQGGGGMLHTLSLGRLVLALAPLYVRHTSSHRPDANLVPYTFSFQGRINFYCSKIADLGRKHRSVFSLPSLVVDMSTTEGLACWVVLPTSENAALMMNQNVGELAISPMDKFMRSLEDMMVPQKPQKDGGEDQILTETSFKGEQRQESQDLDGFRRGLIKQTRRDNFKQQQSFTGYDMYDLIVEKFDVPYDVQINKAVFGGKPVLSFNIMWKYLGQSSFHLSEQEYLEHLEALAQLLKEWDRVDHFKKVLAETKKKPNAYFGYAVALPLDLAPDTLAGYFDGSYF